MLDLGTGTGHMLRRFAPFFESVVAVDRSAGMLERACATATRTGLTKIDFIAADAVTFLENEQATFDLVTCVGFLHHLQPCSLVDLLRRVRGVLADEGVLIISEPVAIQRDEPLAIFWWNRAYSK